MKEALKCKLDPDTDEQQRLARSRLLERELTPGEDIDSLLWDLTKLLDKSSPDLEGAARERELLYYLTEALPRTIHEKILLLPPDTLAKTVDRAKELLLYESRKTPIAPAQGTSDSHDVARASAVLSTLGNAMEQLVQRLERLESKLSTAEPPRSVSTMPRGPYTGKAHVRCVWVWQLSLATIAESAGTLRILR